MAFHEGNEFHFPLCVTASRLVVDSLAIKTQNKKQQQLHVFDRNDRRCRRAELQHALVWHRRKHVEWGINVGIVMTNSWLKWLDEHSVTAPVIYSRLFHYFRQVVKRLKTDQISRYCFLFGLRNAPGTYVLPHWNRSCKSNDYPTQSHYTDTGQPVLEQIPCSQASGKVAIKLPVSSNLCDPTGIWPQPSAPE